MLNFKEGQTYICTNADFGWWTEGKEYKVFNHKKFNKLVLIDDQGNKWLDGELSDSLNEFKLKEEKQMIDVKEGQTYVCKRDKLAWWTLGKEYTVQKVSNGVLYIKDDEGLTWYLPNDNLLNQVFKLQEETQTSNLIENQPHYKNQGIEPIDLMRENFSKEEFAGFLQGNVLKYMLRYKDKNGLEDLKKAKTYLTWLIKEVENNG